MMSETKRDEVAKNPADGLWYVIGFAGRNRDCRQQWVPVSNGMRTKAEALALIPHLARAQRAAIAELGDL